MKNILSNCIVGKNGKRYFFSKNVYEINTAENKGVFMYVSNNDASEKKPFCYIKDKNNVTLDFNGSTLIFSGRSVPFVIDGCKNILIKNVNIKYSSHLYFQTEIVNEIDGNLVLKPIENMRYAIKDNGLVLFFDGGELDYSDKTVFVQEFEKNPVRVAKSSPIRVTTVGCDKQYSFKKDGENIILTSKNKLPFKVGNVLCFFCEGRYADCFIINDSKNVKIENVNIYNSPAMGVIAQVSKNLTLKNVKVEPEKNSEYIISTLADATHFTNCRGKIVLRDCSFFNMNDDGTNIHGIYAMVEKVNEKKLEVSFKHFQQYGVDIYKKGDKITVLDGKTFERKAVLRLKERVVQNEKSCVLKFSKNISASVGDIVENLSANPKVVIKNCKTGGNRPRGFLVATNKKAVIDGCGFSNSECGVGVFADTDFWFEAGATKNIVVKNCNFKCNYGGGESAVTVSPSVKKGKNFFNKKIKIVNNTFDISYGKSYTVYNTEKTVARNNRYVKDGVETGDK